MCVSKWVTRLKLALICIICKIGKKLLPIFFLIFFIALLSLAKYEYYLFLLQKQNAHENVFNEENVLENWEKRKWKWNNLYFSFVFII